VKRHGQPILQSGIHNRLRHGITAGFAFEEWEACTAARLNVETWDAGGYTPAFKAKVIAWHLIRRAIEAHVADAQAEFVKHEQKKARKAAGKKR